MAAILVTGGAGFIGSQLVDALVARGDDVFLVDNFDPFYSETDKRTNLQEALRSPRVRLFEGDVRALGRGLEVGLPEELDVVVHLAARAGVRPSLLDPAAYAAHNVEGTAAVLDWACRRRRPPTFILASSSSVYGDATAVPFEESAALRPVSPYGATKVAAEALLHSFVSAYGIAGVALRFFTVYGPRQRPDLAIRKFSERILRGEEIELFGDGSASRDYTHIDDIVRGVLAAIDRAGRLPHLAYNLGSDRGVRLDALIPALEAALGRRAKVKRAGPQVGDVGHTWADLRRSRDDLDYAPAVPFEDGLRDFAAWLRARPTS